MAWSAAIGVGYAPYAPAPAGLGDLAERLAPAPFERTARIVPGVSFISGETCEVMRGEETLLMGITAQTARVTVCLPGTHSKWVDLVDGRIAAFRTYMTGEIRASLLARGTRSGPRRAADRISEGFLKAWRLQRTTRHSRRACSGSRARQV